MKTELLRILESRRGEFVSGEELAENFGVTRAAVWKAIDALRSSGHVIEAITNRGYSLVRASDALTSEGIRVNLKPSTKISRVVCLEAADSTNNYAKRLAMNGATHGTLVAADRQTAGRGRHGHTFESPAGTGLYMSLVLRPKVEAEKFQMITVAAAVAVCRAIDELCCGAKEKAGIKWVNDVLIGGRKVTGILTEAVSSIESGEIESVITGIGVNVSTRVFPPEFADTAGSIFSEGEYLFGRDELCARIADYVMDFSENLEAPELIQEYRARSILTGRRITYMKNDVKCSGLVEGISDNGGLVVLNASGEREILRSGEVFMIRRKIDED